MPAHNVQQHHHAQTVPVGVLCGAAAMIALSLGVAAVARHAHLTAPPSVMAPARAEAHLRFADSPDGAIAVLDAATGREVVHVAPRSNGFIRGVLRGMFRTRKLESLGHEGSFRLAREADGRLTLTDVETGRRVELDSFGPTNSAAFATLLAADQAQSQSGRSNLAAGTL